MKCIRPFGNRPCILLLVTGLSVFAQIGCRWGFDPADGGIEDGSDGLPGGDFESTDGGIDASDGDTETLDGDGSQVGDGDEGGDEGPQSVFTEIPLLAGGKVEGLVQSPSNPDTLYLMGKPGHVFASDNHGITWRKCTRPPTGVRGLMVSPDDQQVLYLSTHDDVLISTDGCQSWLELGVGPDGYQMLWLAEDDILVGGVTSTGLWRIRNGQRAPVSSPHDGFGIRGLLRSAPGGPLWAGSLGNGVARSDDGGQTWQLMNNPVLSDAGENLEIFSLALDRSDPDRIYIGSEAGLHTTTDAGASWVAVVDDMEVASVVAAGASIMYVRDSWYQVYASDNWGTSFVNLDTREQYMDFAGVLQLAMDHEDSRRIYAMSLRGLFVADDLGAGWSGLNNGLDAWTIVDFALQPDTGIIYLATYGGLLKSSNDGDSWTVCHQGYLIKSATGAVSVQPGSADRVFTCHDRFYMSTDRGSTFTEMSQANSADNWVFTTLAIQGSSWYIGSKTRIWRTTNAGADWTQHSIVGADRQVNELLVLPGEIVLAATSSGIFASVDNGSTFSPSSDGLATTDIACLVHIPGGGFLACNADGVFQSIGIGEIWEPTGLTGWPVHDLLVTGAVVVAATYQGVFYAAHDDLASWTELPGLDDMWPKKLGIAQNGDLLVCPLSFGLQRTPMPQP